MNRNQKQRRAQLRAKAPSRSTSRTKPPGNKARGKSSREKVKAYRERMRKRGMKLIQIWVPDPKSPYFAAEARRQSRLIAESPHEKDDQAFVDSITDWDWD